MDDLKDLDWTASNQNTVSQKLPPMNPISHYPSLRPTPPTSGRSTPFSLQSSSNSFKPPNAPVSRSNNSTPANDSFANLVAFSAPLSSKNLSLEEQQRALEYRKAKEKGQQNKQLNVESGGHEGEFWDRLGDGRITPNPTPAPPSYTATDEYGGQKLSNTINKPFAALKSKPGQFSIFVNGDVDSAFDSSSTKVKNGSNRMPERLGGALADGNAQENIKNATSAFSQTPKIEHQSSQVLLNDDPFGLDVMDYKKAAEAAGSIDDDDILGLLGRPVSEFPPPIEIKGLPSEPTNPGFFDPMDHAIAELVDMGFSTEKSREALESTESGTDVQAAVGWLLNQAHEDSKSSRLQQRPRKPEIHKASQRRSLSASSQSHDDEVSRPAWMREHVPSIKIASRQSSRSPVNGDKDPGKSAAELGKDLFKTANSLWKTGAKKLNKAVSELNSDSDSNQPKWMRESQAKPEARRSRAQVREQDGSDGKERKESELWHSKDNIPSVTDEALMLESRDSRPPPRKPPRQLKEIQPSKSSDSSRDQSPKIPKLRQPNTAQTGFPQQPKFSDIKTKLSRQAIEDQTSDAYISPARRKKPAPKSPSPEPDLLFQDSPISPKPPPSLVNPKSSVPSEIHVSAPKPHARLKPQVRSIPQTSPAALRTSITSRVEGTSAFKRGDYALATTHYTQALSALPSSHPVAIVLLTNRALSHLKTGDPKSSIADSKLALTLIGPSQGTNERIDLADEGSKEMREFWTKAMTRQAEALEQIERWNDAAALWKSCVEAGVGGAVSRAGRSRCEKAAAGLSQPTQSSKPAPPRKILPKPIPKPSVLADLSNGDDEVSAEAVKRLRQANLEAERLDDEKFALSDQVSERLAQWRGGKEGNLRALLASLENVLWDGAGWKKVGMGELIAPAKVKVAYMKGIARVHPDKLSPSATTEQRMISAAVFAALNEAWDGFKRDNSL